MAAISPKIQALFHRSVTDGAFYTYDDRLALITDLHRKPPIAFRAPGATKLGKIPMRAVGYLRNSSGTVEVNTSIDRQLQRVLGYGSRNLLTITKVYADPDTSGRTWIERPGFLSMLLDARAGEFDIVLIEDPDRLARGAIMGLAFEILDALNIAVVELPSERVHTTESIFLHSFLATREVTKIAARTSDGVTRSAGRGIIVKALGYGHTRLHPSGPVIKHEHQAPIVLEAHMLFDSGLTPGQIMHEFNRKFMSGDAHYAPPGYGRKNTKLKLWRRQHFVAGGMFQSGLLTNEQCRGTFISGRTKNTFDKMSGSKSMELLDREEWDIVEDEKLEIVPRDLFDRNQRRLEAMREDARRRREAAAAGKPAKPLAAENRYGSVGTRRLLSGIVCCGVCEQANYTFQQHRGRLIMRCAARNSFCRTNYRADERMLTERLIDIAEAEISSAGSLALFGESFAEQAAGVLGELASSKDEMERQLEALKADLEDNRREAKTAVSDSAKEHYRQRASEIDLQMADLEVRIRAARNPQIFETSRDLEIQQARSLMTRLRDPAIASSKEPDDIWIVQMFRRMCSVTAVPNQHDYGAAAHVELDFSQFFIDNPAVLANTEFKRRFVIRMPPELQRPRRVPIVALNLKMLNEPEKHRLSDEEWAAVQSVLQPAWDATSGKHFSRNKKYYDAVILNLRAGAPPNSIHGPDSGSALGRICTRLRDQRLWAPLLSALRRLGNEWILDLNPSLLTYLEGEGGDKNAPWIVEDVN